MNTVVLSGDLVENAVLRGSKTKVLAFVVETKTGINNPDGGEQTTRVPCVMFNPDPSIGDLLVKQGKGQFVLLQGRVQGTRYDGANRQDCYNAEVVVYTRSFAVCNPLKVQS